MKGKSHINYIVCVHVGGGEGVVGQLHVLQCSEN